MYGLLTYFEFRMTANKTCKKDSQFIGNYFFFSIYKDLYFQLYAHLQEFTAGVDSILGETSDQRELFELGLCYDSKITEYTELEQVEVQYWDVPQDWALIGGNFEKSVDRTAKNR